MKRWAAFLLIGLAPACRTVPVLPPPPSLPPRPALERTFGAFHLRPGAGAVLDYKDMRIGYDLSKSRLAEESSGLDFLLLSSAQDGWPPAVRRDLKVLGTPEVAGAAAAAGLVNAKAIGPGQRLMLSKKGAFAFVSAVQARHPATGKPRNAYMLEFDNGRNLFISGATTDVPSLREFVYTLRDDGKELHLAVIEVAAAKDGQALARPDEALAAEIAALLQPKIAVMVNAGGASRERLAEAFESQILNGEWYLTAQSDEAPF